MRFVGTLACFAFVISTTASARADIQFIKLPTQTFSTKTPIHITETSVFADTTNNSTFRACVSFTNVATKPASLVTFTFRFNDAIGDELVAGVLQRPGTFGPGIEIAGKMSLLGGNSDSLNNCITLTQPNVVPSSEIVRVTEVRFEDGTVWKLGDPMPGAQPVPEPGGGGGGNNGNATVNINGATGIGITLGSSGGTFGAIAWLPGSHKMFGTSLDKGSQADADYEAQVKCNTLNGGGTACKLMLELSGNKNRCGAILLDDTVSPPVAGLAQGPDNNDTIKAAAEVLSKKGGNLGADSIVTVVCNTK
jgi:hypothetical protein